MDGVGFDRVTRTLTAAVSRRRALAVLFGIAVASAGGDASAAVRGRPCQRLGVQCTRDGQCCSGVCVTSRAPGRSRRQVCGCPAGQDVCGRVCVSLATDVDNCGACGAACGDRGDGCADGACTCGDGPGCGDAEQCIDGLCAPTSCSVVQGAWTCLLLLDGSVIDTCSTDGINNNGGTSKDCAADADCQTNCTAGADCYCAAGKGYYDSIPEYTAYPNGRCIEIQQEFTGSPCQP